MSSAGARVVVVTRPSPYERLLSRHGTHGQAAFFLEERGESLEPLHASHVRRESVLERTMAAIPTDWRRAHTTRGELDRFLWEPNDIVVAVGQDGLVANAAKYLAEMRVIGVNPEPEAIDGILVRHAVEALPDLLQDTARGRVSTEDRTMVRACVDGEQLDALNEIFVGHRTHQSSRYRIACTEGAERQSSSGVIVATGTGSTGWVRSIARQRSEPPELPEPCARQLSYWVREPFPSQTTSTTLECGIVHAGRKLRITSEMNDGGVIFGDGIEADRIAFDWGRTVEIGRSPLRLRLVI